jgi:hypothetical protein
MIEATQRKLRQAQFFYRHLVAERDRTVRNEPEAFEFYFSAFVMTARNVSWTMKHEEPEKYVSWNRKWEESLSDDERKLLKLANDLRIDEVKRAGANTIREWQEVASDELLSTNLDFERQHPAYIMMRWSALPGIPAAKTIRPAYYLEHEGGRAEVTAKCKEYLDYLEKLVREFLLAHDQQPPP